jgi:hypothetical protein
MTEEQKWLNSRSSPDNIPFQRQVAWLSAAISVRAVPMWWGRRWLVQLTGNAKLEIVVDSREKWHKHTNRECSTDSSKRMFPAKCYISKNRFRSFCVSATGGRDIPRPIGFIGIFSGPKLLVLEAYPSHIQ